MGAIGLFFSSLFSNFGKQIMIGIAIVAFFGFGYLYWHNLQNKISTLTQENTILTTTVNTQDATISKLQSKVKQIQQDLNTLNTNYSNIDKNTNSTQNQLTFGKIDKTNKKTVEQTVNTTYNNIFQNLTTETQPDSFK